MTDPFIIAAIALVFLFAGGIKGVIGLGLPTVSLGLLAIFLDLTTAMALLTMPAAATNVWQAAVGGNARMIVRRLWPFMLAATITVWLGAMALTRVDLALLVRAPRPDPSRSTRVSASADGGSRYRSAPRAGRGPCSAR